MLYGRWRVNGSDAGRWIFAAFVRVRDGCPIGFTVRVDAEWISIQLRPDSKPYERLPSKMIPSGSQKCDVIAEQDVLRLFSLINFFPASRMLCERNYPDSDASLNFEPRNTSGGRLTQQFTCVASGFALQQVVVRQRHSTIPTPRVGVLQWRSADAADHRP
jgi:hypothetical protein